MSQPTDEPHHFQLKPVTVEHLQSISDWYQNLDELALIESHLPLPVNSQSLENLWKRDIDQKAPRTSYLYSICNADDEPVGFTGLQDLNLTYGSGVAFIFIEANHRRHGLALCAIALILDMAFHQLRLHRVTTFVNCDNQPSLDLIKRVGFRDEGCMRESCFFDGKYHDVNVVGLLAPEWQAHRTALSDTLDGNTRLSIGHNGDTNWSWPLT
jgi:RimJ/RimL family protein N-acetyltransferase